jgi:hypothetical protein
MPHAFYITAIFKVTFWLTDPCTHNVASSILLFFLITVILLYEKNDIAYLTYYALCRLLNNYLTHVKQVVLIQNKTQIKSNEFQAEYGLWQLTFMFYFLFYRSRNLKFCIESVLKPVYNDHPWDLTRKKWSLFQGGRGSTCHINIFKFKKWRVSFSKMLLSYTRWGLQKPLCIEIERTYFN